MSESRDLAWSDNSLMELSTDSAKSYLAEQYRTDFFVKGNDNFTLPRPVSRSYDSLPSIASAGQLFEVASNDGSTMGSSTFNDSSASSSRFGTRHDSFSDIQSRKASMSSTYDGTSGFPPDRSPEAIAGRRGSWYPTEEQVNMNYNLPYGKQAANSILNQDSHVPPEMTSFQRAISNNCTSPSQLLHARNYSVASNYGHDMKSASSASSSSLLSRNHSLSLPQPLSDQSSFFDPSISQEAGFKTDQGPTLSRSRSSTAGSTRKLKFKRSRTGCMVCRKRKVKCDQDGLPCKQCRIGKRECHYEDNPPKRRRKSKLDDEFAEGSSTTLRNEEMLPPNSAQSLSNLRAEIESTRSEKRSTESSDIIENQEEITTTTTTTSIPREDEEDLKRKTDALFAQHTNINEVGAEDTIVGRGSVANSFNMLDAKELEAGLLSATSIESIGSTSVDSAISDQTLENSFEANFANLSSHTADVATAQLDFKQNDGPLASSFSSFTNFSDQDADNVNYGGNGDGNVHCW